MSHRVYQIADVAGRQYIIPSTVVKQQEPDLASVPQPSQVSIQGVESLLHFISNLDGILFLQGYIK